MSVPLRQQQYSLVGNMSQILMDLLSSLTSCIYCFPGSPSLKINNRSFKMQHLLGEGGFSYVYLVQEISTSTLYALKKIRCPFGRESVALALKEVEAYTLFTPHPNIIHAIDHSVVSAGDRSDPGAKTVYILLPYYRRGNLQDAINANLVNHTKFPERRLMILFLGVARALKAMHGYRVKGAPGGAASQKKARAVREEAAQADEDAERQTAKGKRRRKGGGGRKGGQPPPGDDDDADEIEQEPLMDGEVIMSQEGVADGELRAYAHRDVKPGNIMIDDTGKFPILMDLGSIAPSPTAVTSRSLALNIQDTAAEHSTMPYRAPELFDVKTGSIIDTKVDIWSYGCTLYACLVGKSPFEARSDETGGSLSICVLGGDWRFPDEGREAKGKGRVQGQGMANGGADSGGGAAAAAGAAPDAGISQPVREVVRRCLRVEPGERPDIDEVISMVEDVVAGLPEDEAGDV